MKKKLPLLVLSAIMLFGIASCGGDNPTGSTTGGGNTPTTSESSVTVESVTIANESGTTNVLGGSKTNLTYSVNGSATGLKVDWSSSDTDVATVKNGAVKFANVTENKEVTITATSRDDATKSDSITFNVHHSPINLSTSTANELDYSSYLEDGIITHTYGGDPSILFNGVYGTQWYVEAELSIEDFAESENYAKYGIMTGTSENGTWMSTADGVKTAFYYVALDRSDMSGGWKSLSMVPLNSELNNWDWSGKHVADFSVANDDKVMQGESFRIGLLRDGINYYCFYGTVNNEADGEVSTASEDNSMKCYAKGQWSTIAADEPSYAWIGGFQTSATIKNIRTVVGENINDLYDQPTELKFDTTETLLFVGESYKLNPTADKILFNSKGVTYSSSDETIVTVSEDGTIKGISSGAATITAKYGELTATFKVWVSNDPKDKVDIDGKKDDLIYSDINKYEFALNGDGEHIDFYAAKNLRGIYIFADIYVNALKGNASHSDWWENDNFEVNFITKNSDGGIKRGGQIWTSANGTANFDKCAAIVNREKDETTGKYNVKLEVFSEYNSLGVGTVDKDTILGVVFGSNPATGWRSSIGWDGSFDFGYYLKFTKNGLARSDSDIEAELCPNSEHDMTDWYISKAASCLVNGEQEKYCKICGHEEHKVVEANGVHTYWTKYDHDHLNILTESTCSTHGTYTTSCKYCGEKLDTEFNDLPLLHCSNLKDNATGHEGKWIEDSEDVYGGYWDCCGTSHKEPILNENKKNSGGWQDRSQWTEIANGLVGDFELTVEWKNETGMNEKGVVEGFQWQHPLLVVSDGDKSNWSNDATMGDTVMFRLDWCQYEDDRNADGLKIAESYENNVWTVNNWFQDLANVICGGTVRMNAKRVGNDLTMTYVLTGADGTVYENLYQKVNGIRTNIIDISLSAEYASFTLNSVRLVEAE